MTMIISSTSVTTNANTKSSLAPDQALAISECSSSSSVTSSDTLHGDDKAEQNRKIDESVVLQVQVLESGEANFFTKSKKEGKEYALKEEEHAEDKHVEDVNNGQRNEEQESLKQQKRKIDEEHREHQHQDNRTKKRDFDKMKEGGGNNGRRGDPRMHKAVAARLARPDLSLFQALIIGGFIFPDVPSEIKGMSSNRSYDTDNVLLSQRKNQLSRRLRHHARKKAREDHNEVMLNQRLVNIVPTNYTRKMSIPENLSFLHGNTDAHLYTIPPEPSRRMNLGSYFQAPPPPSTLFYEQQGLQQRQNQSVQIKNTTSSLYDGGSLFDPSQNNQGMVDLNPTDDLVQMNIQSMHALARYHTGRRPPFAQEYLYPNGPENNPIGLNMVSPLTNNNAVEGPSVNEEEYKRELQIAVLYCLMVENDALKRQIAITSRLKGDTI